MKRAGAVARAANRAEQYFVAREGPGLDRLGDTHHVLVNHAPRADRQMADFGIAHHTGSQADRLTRSVDLGMRLRAIQTIHRGRPRHRDRVGLALGPQAPSIENDQHRNWGTPRPDRSSRAPTAAKRRGAGPRGAGDLPVQHRHRYKVIRVLSPHCALERWRRDSDDLEWTTVDRDRLPHYTSVRSKVRLPVVEAQYNDGIRTGRRIVHLRQQPSVRSGYAQHAEVIATDDLRVRQSEAPFRVMPISAGAVAIRPSNAAP